MVKVYHKFQSTTDKPRLNGDALIKSEKEE